MVKEKRDRERREPTREIGNDARSLVPHAIDDCATKDSGNNHRARLSRHHDSCLARAAGRGPDQPGNGDGSERIADCDTCSPIVDLSEDRTRIYNGNSERGSNLPLLIQKVLFVQCHESINSCHQGCGDSWCILQFDVKFNLSDLMMGRSYETEPGLSNDGVYRFHHVRRFATYGPAHLFTHIPLINPVHPFAEMRLRRAGDEPRLDIAAAMITLVSRKT